MKTFITALILFVTFPAFSQIQQATLQASGLTCSMCSNAINKSLQSLPFVEKVISNIQESSFTIHFVKNETISFDAIKDKVEDAGFSVADLSLQLDLGNTPLLKDTHITQSGMTFHILGSTKGLTGIHKIHFADKGFVSNKQYKKNKNLTGMTCYDTGKAESCCTSQGMIKGERMYHVTI